MRLLLAALVVFTTAPAFAACPVPRVSDWGGETADGAAYAACLQRELSAGAIDAQRLAQLEADYRLRLQLLQLEQQLQRQMA
ncbi:MAG TPA: hypothetical protein VFE52_10060, partial [Devosia sp.]|nr:hypothetical protein [Devosia sp.]